MTLGGLYGYWLSNKPDDSLVELDYCQFTGCNYLNVYVTMCRGRYLVGSVVEQLDDVMFKHVLDETASGFSHEVETSKTYAELYSKILTYCYETSKVYARRWNKITDAIYTDIQRSNDE